GTLASSSDEWIELFNPGSEAIDLANWRLTDGGDLDRTLAGIIEPRGFCLLERTDDQTVSDIVADLIYTGALSNDGERLELLDPSGASVDVANRGGSAWPAGDAETHASMERKQSGGWGTYTGYYGNGHDAAGSGIVGTPHAPNSLLFPTPVPTWIPGQVVVNEVLVRPHYDWEGTGGTDLNDEFIELYNRGPHDVQLGGWILDDLRNGGSTPFVLSNRLIQAEGYAVFFRTLTHLALNDTGDTVTLRAPNGHTVDTISYLRVRAYNLSYGRLPDGSDHLVYGLWPSPGNTNRIYTPPSFPVGSILVSEVAWAGTLASANDEWIELWNPGKESISLAGWALTDDNDIWAPLTGMLAPGGYCLLERTDDETISDLPADGIYRGALSDDGERLRLVDPSGRDIDVVNATGAWPGGQRDSRVSIERLGEEWLPFTGELGRGLDADGWPILGTPGGANSRDLEAALSAASSCAQGAAPAAGPCP
ncbi:MAG: lamin tail domain-containing protein, partial [Anaerolineales bacterium]|nr:lamin tail domain-containing protein [Anaerolineales bacterium]